MKSAKAIPVLMYHHVCPNPGLVTVSPEAFLEQMIALKQAGYRTITADDMGSFLDGNPLPQKSVMITFDDGYLDNYVYAYPILQQLGLHAIIFAVTGWIKDGPIRPNAGDSTGALPMCPDHQTCKAAIGAGFPDKVMMRWSEIAEMEQKGVMETHSHTHSHVRWDEQFPEHAARLDALKADLEQSSQAIQAKLRKKSRHLCWPWGRFDGDYQNIATALGFDMQYTVDPHVNDSHTSRQNIGRIVAKDRDGSWLTQRLWIYSRPWVASVYNRLKSRKALGHG